MGYAMIIIIVIVIVVVIVVIIIVIIIIAVLYFPLAYTTASIPFAFGIYSNTTRLLPVILTP